MISLSMSKGKDGKTPKQATDTGEASPAVKAVSF